MVKVSGQSRQRVAADVQRQQWRVPNLVRHSVADITRLGFGTDCDGGIFGVIDGSAVNCPPG